MDCKHDKLRDINVVVLAGVINRKMTICKECGEVIKSQDYEV